MDVRERIREQIQRIQRARVLVTEAQARKEEAERELRKAETQVEEERRQMMADGVLLSAVARTQDAFTRIGDACLRLELLGMSFKTHEWWNAYHHDGIAHLEWMAHAHTTLSRMRNSVRMHVRLKLSADTSIEEHMSAEDWLEIREFVDGIHKRLNAMDGWVNAAYHAPPRPLRKEANFASAFVTYHNALPDGTLPDPNAVHHFSLDDLMHEYAGRCEEMERDPRYVDAKEFWDRAEADFVRNEKNWETKYAQ